MQQIAEVQRILLQYRKPDRRIISDGLFGL